MTATAATIEAATQFQPIDPNTLARLWAEDWRAPICSPLRDMIRSDECDGEGAPTMAAFERIAAELNAQAPDPDILARLWAEDSRPPICLPLGDMIRSDECDGEGAPTMAAFERIAAELNALTEACGDQGAGPHKSAKGHGVTATAATTETAAKGATSEVAESAPAKKAPAKKAPAKKAPAKSEGIEPTKVIKRREVVAENAEAVKAEMKTVLKTVPIDRIDRDPSQPRELFDQAKLEELAGSIRELGQLQPISLRYVPATRRYVIIMGERRWRAAGMAGLSEMTALVFHGVEAGSRELLAMAVAENVGRADMTSMEEAKAFKRLEKAGFTVDEIAGRCGKSAAYVGWRMDLLRLCEPAQEALGKGHLPVGMAWYVSQLSRDNQMRFLAKYARGAFANDRDAEAFVKATRAEEERRESQGSFFVLADETTAKPGGTQELLPGAHDVTEEERERIITDRTKLTKKIDKLSTAGEILSELATADPEELALLLDGVGGGLASHQHRVEHLRGLMTKVIKNLRDAQAIAAVRAGAIQINPDAVATQDPAETEADAPAEADAS